MIVCDSIKIIRINKKSYKISLYDSTNDGSIFLSENEARQYSEGIVASTQPSYKSCQKNIKKKRNGVPPKRKDLPF